MALPELLANSPTPGSDVAITTLGAAVVTTPAAGTVETWTFAASPPAALAAVGQFRFVVDSEICIDITGGSGTSRQVQRGAEGSTVATHANGASVYHKLTAGGLFGLLQSTTPSLIGSRQTWFGHSFLAGGGASHLDRQFVTLLAGLERTDLIDLGVGAAQAANDQLWTRATAGGGQVGWGGWAWVLQNVNPFRTGAPYGPGANSLPCVMLGLNDATQRSHQATGNPRTIFKTAMRTILARFCASRVIQAAEWTMGATTNASPNLTTVNRWNMLATGMKLWGTGIPSTNTISSFTPAPSGTIVMNANATSTNTLRLIFAYESLLAYGGITWQTPKIDQNKNSGNVYWPIPGNNATITFTIPADFEGGVVDFVFLVWPGSDGQITWSGTAGVTGTTTLSGLAYADGTDAATQNTPQRKSSNGHTVRHTLTSANAGQTIIATYGSGAGTAFATPSAPSVSVQGTVGVVTYSYQRVYRTYNGDTIPSTSGTVTTGNATLSGTNFNRIAAGGAWPSGVETELILRVTGGTTQGVIAALSAPAVVDDNVAGGLPAQGYSANTANPLTGGAAFDSVSIESTSPTTRGVVCNIVTPPAAVLTAIGTGVTATDIANYNTDLQSVVNEFATGQFLYINCDTMLGAAAANFATGTANVHPNDRGHGILAEGIAAAITDWAADIPLRHQAMQSRVGKRVTARTQAMRRYTGLGPAGHPLAVTGGVDLLGRPTVAGGDYTLPATLSVVDATNLQLFLDAQIGDDVEVELYGILSNVATGTWFDIAVCDSNGAPLRFFSANFGTEGTANTFGWPAWYNPGATANFLPVSGSAFTTVQRGDLQTVNTISGVLVLRLYGASVSGTRILYGGSANTFPMLSMQARNLGPRNTPGFNAS